MYLSCTAYRISKLRYRWYICGWQICRWSICRWSICRWSICRWDICTTELSVDHLSVDHLSVDDISVDGPSVDELSELYELKGRSSICRSPICRLSISRSCICRSCIWPVNISLFFQAGTLSPGCALFRVTGNTRGASLLSWLSSSFKVWKKFAQKVLHAYVPLP